MKDHLLVKASDLPRLIVTMTEREWSRHKPFDWGGKTWIAVSAVPIPNKRLRVVCKEHHNDPE